MIGSRKRKTELSCRCLKFEHCLNNDHSSHHHMCEQRGVINDLKKHMKNLHLNPLRTINKKGTQENVQHDSEQDVKPSSKQVLHRKGQLKLAVYVNYGLLTVNVDQARHLSNKKRELLNPYVKLSLMPDDSRRTRCRTEVVTHTNNPEFDEKFSFELLGEDIKKRLFVSIWHREKGHDHGEFLGCMSFGIQHIMSMQKIVDGWYYLLTDDVGRRKHLQVATRLPPPGESEGGTYIPAVPSLPPSVQTSPMYHEVINMEPHVFVVRRVGASFGFSVMAHSFGPVFVSKVDAGSPAESSGLRVDDKVIRINGTYLSRAMVDKVAKIIKKSEKKVILEVQRPIMVERGTPAISPDSVYETLPRGAGHPSYPPTHPLWGVTGPLNTVASDSGISSAPAPRLSPIKEVHAQSRLIPDDHKENLHQTMMSEAGIGLCGMMRRKRKTKITKSKEVS